MVLCGDSFVDVHINKSGLGMKWLIFCFSGIRLDIDQFIVRIVMVSLHAKFRLNMYF